MKLHSWKETVYKMMLCVFAACYLIQDYTFLPETHKTNMYKNQHILSVLVLRLFPLLQYNTSSCYTDARLDCSSIQGSAPRGNWNVTLYPSPFRSVQRNKILSSSLFLSYSTSLPPSLSVPPSLAASVCLHFSLCFSYHKPPSWKKPLHKKILQQSRPGL